MRITTNCRTPYALLIGTLGLWLVSTMALGQMATYEVIFDSIWDPGTHPYPSGAHFSSLIGASHDDSVSFWEAGELASQGIEIMAETGGILTLRNEILAVGSAAEVITGPGLSNPPRMTSLTADVDISRPLVTLVTMVAPSPDWFVGVSGLDLRQNGAWINSITATLFVYDAGTDSGVNFTSPNSNTNPAEPIHLLDAPFTGSPPLGSFVFNLISVAGLTGDFDADGDYSVSDIDALVGAIVAGEDSPAFDLNGDAVVDTVDLADWRAEAGAAELASGNPYLEGDADLDGNVDVVDFNRWNEAKFTAGGLWSGGDFDANGFTEVADFNLWNKNRFTTADVVSTVPEPTSGLLLLLSVAGILNVSRVIHRHSHFNNQQSLFDNHQ